MRIVNEKYLSLVWNWDEYEKNGIVTKYQGNLDRLVDALEKRVEAGKYPAEEDVRRLAGELQEAGELLEQSTQRCLTAAGRIYEFAARTSEDRAERAQRFEQLRNHIGKPVILSQTSAPELEGKQLILEDVNGVKGILRDGDDLWEALIDFLVPVLDYATPEQPDNATAPTDNQENPKQ